MSREPDPMQVVQVAVTALAEMAAPYNPRKIEAHDLEALRRSLRYFGVVEPVVANSRSGNIVGGHQRVKAALAEGMETLPVVYVDLDDPSEKQLNLALNRISGSWDEKLLGELLADLETAGADLSLTGFTEQELEQLFKHESDLPADIDHVTELVDEAITQPGDLIVLGVHRLLCGDATRPEDVSRLLNGAKPLLMVTDPPYGVDYDPSWRHRAGINHSARVGDVRNDQIVDWRAAWKLFPGAIAFVWHAGIHAGLVAESLEAAELEIRAQIVWAKDRFAISRGHYHWQHEPCWYAVRKGATASWAGDRKQTTLWQIAARDPETTVHGTQKPVECMRRPIVNHSNAGQAVYDPFLGSGTTLIAAEFLKRVCYGLEIDPRYCDVIVKRWEAFTGRKADGWRGHAASVEAERT